MRERRVTSLFPDRMDPAAGFSLIETLVAVAIVAAVLTATILPASRILERSAVEAQASRLADFLSNVRIRAAYEGRDAIVRVDAEKRTASSRFGAISLPLEYKLTLERVARQAGPIRELRFSVTGASTGAVLHLRRGASSASVTIDWLTGRVEFGS